MRAAYSRLAWGLALELIDIRIQHFDILPDVLGYLLIMIGLSGIQPQSKLFRVAWGTAGVQLLISIPQLIGRLPSSLSLFPGESSGVNDMIVSNVGTLLDLVMMYGICIGIREKALSAEVCGDLAHMALRVWQAVFGFGAAMLILLPFALNAGLVTGMLFLFFGLGDFIASLWVIALVRKTDRMFAVPDRL
ncbi:hypothetical protein [Cohnella zeiphila]|uniref:Uncharacterized protein n=1 Tax=Cohnella zeiphila TaxID=2761120 RepID=A0A7X0SPB5_9BACL|nr:hypothetical protein [Cohnella zeiphila]MBB6733594.1 hypothetical protein [Cohnella zeiphila]